MLRIRIRMLLGLPDPLVRAQRYESEDLDTYQNVRDPQHLIRLSLR
jgi:hypothetical protein